MKEWKTLALVFLGAFLISFCFNVYLFKGGFEIAKNQNICAFEICDPEIHDAYYYDSTKKMCYCFIDGDEVKAEKLGGAQK